MSTVEVSKSLHNKRQHRLAAYSLAYDSKKQEKATVLYPLAPAFKELSDYLVKDHGSKSIDIKKVPKVNFSAVVSTQGSTNKHTKSHRSII